MKFTFFSFVMAVIWSGVLFSIIALLQKNARTIRYLSIKMIFAVYIVSIFRFLFPVEFPFTIIVGDRELYAPIYRALCLDTYSIGSWEFSLVHVVVACWLIRKHHSYLQVLSSLPEFLAAGSAVRPAG